ncbi:amine oxidase [Flagelloscypha sp. PMI_526]|nr:amine oxidase [Flagelloscypha sp. PMI_526]
MKIAVVGSGVSGLGATWLLNEHGPDHEVHLFESDSRTGGHANTIRFFQKGEGQTPEEGVDVDTGFIVLNPTTYPNFLRFLQSPRPRSSPTLESQIFPGTFKIDIIPTEMTFSVSRMFGNGRRLFEWAGDNLSAVFTQRQRLLDPGMWRMIWDVLRFNACARRVLHDTSGKDLDLGIGAYLKREGYSDRFKDDYLIPMTAAIWSTPPDKCVEDFPVRTLIQFMKNHHLLQLTGKPKWLTISGGSRRYVDSITSQLPPSQLHVGNPVVAVRSTSANTVELVYQTSAGGEVTETFDHVILATHSDTALKILRKGGNVTAGEEDILGRFKWSQNECVLHYDDKLMPRSREAWSCWNYLTYCSNPTEGKPNSDIISLTYGMNHLQHISLKKYGPVLVTLNPPAHIPIDQNKTLGSWKYEHPVIDSEAVKAQSELWKIQGKRGISFAGAYTKYGFHEDGFTSGLLAAAELLPDDPRYIKASSSSSPTYTAFETESYIAQLNARKSQNLPFPILPPHRDTAEFNIARDWPIMLLIGFFEYCERSGWRAWNGMIGGFWLWWTRVVLESLLGMTFDF